MIIKGLNFDWTFKRGFDNNTTIEEIQGELVHLPHSVNYISKNYFDEQLTQGLFTYQKHFEYSLKNGNRLFLICYGIMNKATLYLNGHELTTHIGGYTKFNVELTDYLKPNNLLTICVDSRETGENPPYGNVVDYLTYGGIYREVELLETGPNAFDYVLIDGDDSKLNIQAKINSKTTENNYRFDIYDDTLLVDQIVIVSNDIHLSLTHQHNLKLWTINEPKLYTLKAYINENFVYQTRFGLRTIKVNDQGLYLNNELIFLRGLNRHQSYPYVGYAMPASAQIKDADILKDELQVNIVRSSHYPPSKHFLDRCDEIGLLVFTELPGWQHIGDETWKEHALNDLKDLVIEDYNHPSVIIIGTRINESKDDDEFYRKTRDLVKSIDQSRPTGGVRDFAYSNLLEDIYTINDFIHRGNNQGLSKKKSKTKEHNPYLVTEFNGHMYPTKSFDDELKRVNHSLRHFNVLNDAYKMKGLMGAIGWCMNDYNTHIAFGSNDHICYHGVLDINRNSKYAASVYASQGSKPYMNVLSMMHIGELPAGEIKSIIVATNCEKVELYKGDSLIGTHYPSKEYKYLPHPPVIINDFIGNSIAENEIFTKKEADRIKSIMLYMLNHNLKMRILDKIYFSYILYKYKLTYSDAIKLYTKYVGGWGDADRKYTFKGYINNECVLTMKKGSNDDYQLSAICDNLLLKHQDTYDVTRCTVELANEVNERAFYSNEVLKITVSDNIALIGPASRTLQGGIESFWVKSIKPGKATIKIASQHYNELTINLTITE